MNPSEILRELMLGSPRREQARAQLFELLQQLARRTEIPDQDRGDVVHLVWIHLVTKSAVVPLPCVDSGDEACRRYLTVSIRHRWLDVLKKGKGPPPEPPPQEAPEAIAAAEDRYEELERDLERFAQIGRAAMEAKRSHAEQHATTWTQLEVIARGRATMDEVLARYEGITPDSTQEQVGLARDRVLQQHHRWRVRMRRYIQENCHGDERERMLRVLDGAFDPRRRSGR